MVGTSAIRLVPRIGASMRRRSFLVAAIFILTTLDEGWLCSFLRAQERTKEGHPQVAVILLASEEKRARNKTRISCYSRFSPVRSAQLQAG